MTYFCLNLILFGYINLNATENFDTNDTLKHYIFTPVNIIESKTKVFEEIPGSAIIINNSQIELCKPNTFSDLLTRYPGIHIANEDGLGLRLNLGIRGLQTDRSRSLLVMEDGIPVALAPYGEPEMYYSPNIDRISGIEILKGSGSILYGPQTIGGVLNLLTNDPPIGTRYYAGLSGGSGGFLKTRLGYGNGAANLGFLVEYHRKQADNLYPTNYKVNDLITKFKIKLDERSNLNFKAAFYDEQSNSTYLGITQNMYDKGEYYTNLAPNDNLDIRRYLASISHNLIINNNIVLNTVVYGYTTTRNWLRQDFSRKPHNNQTGQIFGDTNITHGAIYMLNSTGGRNRQFEVFGIEPRISCNYSFLSLRNELKTGIRFLYEKAFEQMIIGNKQNALSGQMRDNETRTGNAFSGYFQNRIFLNDDIIVTPGLRIEHFVYERKIVRWRNVDTLIQNENNITGFIPGIGLNYNFNEENTLFAGLHKGFAPPRIKDAITSQGEALLLEPENSWNAELGWRSKSINWLTFEITLYLLEFSNQIIPVSQSAGGTGTGLINGGKTSHKGIEASLALDLSYLFRLPFEFTFETHSTYSNSIYSADRFVTIGESKFNIINNSLPYAPNLKWSGIINLITSWGLAFELASIYTGKQYTDELNTLEPTADGQIGIIDGYHLLNLTAKYHLFNNMFISISIKNLLDERYISSRRPQGIKVGLPRLIMAGIDFNI